MKFWGTLIILILAFAALLALPLMSIAHAAETFVNRVITSRNLSTEPEISAVQSRIDQIEIANRERERLANAAAAHTAAQDEKLSNIQELLTEQRIDIKELLKTTKSQ